MVHSTAKNSFDNHQSPLFLDGARGSSLVTTYSRQCYGDRTLSPENNCWIIWSLWKKAKTVYNWFYKNRRFFYWSLYAKNSLTSTTGNTSTRYAMLIPIYCTMAGDAETEDSAAAIPCTVRPVCDSDLRVTGCPEVRYTPCFKKNIHSYYWL